MTEWRSLEHIVRTLDLSADPRQVSDVEKEIRRRLAEIHPDRNGGEFETDSSRYDYDELATALKFCRVSESGGKAISLHKSDLPELLDALREITRQNDAVDTTTLRDSCKAQVVSESKARYAFRIKASGIFAAISGGLLAFSGSLKDNPIFGPLFQHSILSIALVVACTVSVALYLLTLLVEHREEQLTDYLLSRRGRKEILQITLPYPTDDTPDPVYLDSDELVSSMEYIQEKRLLLLEGKHIFGRRKLPEIQLGKLGESSLERIAKTIIRELEGQRIMEKVSEKRVSPRYAVSCSVLDQVWDR